MTEKQLTRLGERLIRLHYDLHAIGLRLQYDGRDLYADSVRDIGRRLSKLGTTIRDGGNSTP